LQRAAELAPQSPQMQYNLAFTYYELKRFEEARQPIAKAVQRWPDIFQLNSLYGAFYLSSAKIARPIRCSVARTKSIQRTQGPRIFFTRWRSPWRGLAQAPTSIR